MHLFRCCIAIPVTAANAVSGCLRSTMVRDRLEGLTVTLQSETIIDNSNSSAEFNSCMIHLNYVVFLIYNCIHLYANMHITKYNSVRHQLHVTSACMLLFSRVSIVQFARRYSQINTPLEPQLPRDSSKHQK